jgi:hypothetical protein
MKQFYCPKDIESLHLLKKIIFMVGDYQIQDKLINHTSHNQLTCKINDIHVHRDVLTHPHNLHCQN